MTLVSPARHGQQRLAAVALRCPAGSGTTPDGQGGWKMMGKFCPIANPTFYIYDSQPQIPVAPSRSALQAAHDQALVPGSAHGTQACQEPQVLPAHRPPHEPSASPAPCAQAAPGPPITPFWRR